MGRKSSRRHAFTIIFQIPFYKESFDAQAAAREYISNEGIMTEDAVFMLKLIDGVTERLPEIDLLVGKYAGWGFDRVATADLAILRLAIFEMLYSVDAPISVVINEAVELAKAYGTDDSAAFVNGLLAQVAKNHPK